MRLSIVVLVLAAAGCGQQIGDSCIVSSDCSLDGTRTCDVSQDQGYCTIQGCDYSTCPEEAACIRFFMGGFTNKPCDPANGGTSADTCTLDELCSLENQCVPRSAEVRYCMKKCDKDTDCRDGYECRDLTLMKAHGGEPVLGPTEKLSEAPKFCAMAPAS